MSLCRSERVKIRSNWDAVGWNIKFCRQSYYSVALQARRRQVLGTHSVSAKAVCSCYAVRFTKEGEQWWIIVPIWRTGQGGLIDWNVRNRVSNICSLPALFPCQRWKWKAEQRRKPKLCYRLSPATQRGMLVS